jgi:hypothetical protein
MNTSIKIILYACFIVGGINVLVTPMRLTWLQYPVITARSKAQDLLQFFLWLIVPIWIGCILWGA